MRLKRMTCILLVFILMVITINIPVNAAEAETTTSKNSTMDLGNPRVTRAFSMSFPAKSKVLANSSFPLTDGETVTIKASYSPFSASVDFGLVAPDGVFYYFDITSGSIDKMIQVDQSGNYTFQIRNNSNFEVDVSGFVNY